MLRVSQLVGFGAVSNRDPYFSSVSLLAHFEGANGATSFVDSSKNALTLTTAGNAQLSNLTKPYGQTSLLLDGSGDYVTVPGTGGQFGFGSGDFTVEVWIKTSQTDQTYLLMQDGGFTLRYNFSSSGRLEFLDGGFTSRIAATGTGINDGNWHHVALCRVGSTIRLFLGGAVLGSYSPGGSIGHATNTLFISRWYNSATGEEVTGNLKDIRITKGIGRYPAAFTPLPWMLPDR